MELGLTIPLQTYLKIKQLEDRTQKDLFFCWELHRIQLQSRDTLVAVNSSNRLAVVMSGMDGAAWRDFPLVFTQGLRQVLGAEGYRSCQIEAYLSQAGPLKLTRTHGRRSVVGLNRMDDCLWSVPVLVDETRLFQQVHCMEANRQRCRMAGHEGYQEPSYCWEIDMDARQLLHIC